MRIFGEKLSVRELVTTKRRIVLYELSASETCIAADKRPRRFDFSLSGVNPS
jgi:hypothetical protein